VDRLKKKRVTINEDKNICEEFQKLSSLESEDGSVTNMVRLDHEDDVIGVGDPDSYSRENRLSGFQSSSSSNFGTINILVHHRTNQPGVLGLVRPDILNQI
jgi:hypothetical protein